MSHNVSFSKAADKNVAMLYRTRLTTVADGWSGSGYERAEEACGDCMVPSSSSLYGIIQTFNLRSSSVLT